MDIGIVMKNNTALFCLVFLFVFMARVTAAQPNVTGEMQTPWTQQRDAHGSLISSGPVGTLISSIQLPNQETRSGNMVTVIFTTLGDAWRYFGVGSGFSVLFNGGVVEIMLGYDQHVREADFTRLRQYLVSRQLIPADFDPFHMAESGAMPPQRPAASFGSTM